MNVGYRGKNHVDKERIESADPTPSKNPNVALESMKEMLRRVRDRNVDFEIADMLSGISPKERRSYMKHNTAYASQIGVCDEYIFENSMNKSLSSQ